MTKQIKNLLSLSKPSENLYGSNSDPSIVNMATDDTSAFDLLFGASPQVTPPPLPIPAAGIQTYSQSATTSAETSGKAIVEFTLRAGSGLAEGPIQVDDKGNPLTFSNMYQNALNSITNNTLFSDPEVNASIANALSKLSDPGTGATTAAQLAASQARLDATVVGYYTDADGTVVPITVGIMNTAILNSPQAMASIKASSFNYFETRLSAVENLALDNSPSNKPIAGAPQATHSDAPDMITLLNNSTYEPLTTIFLQGLDNQSPLATTGSSIGAHFEQLMTLGTTVMNGNTITLGPNLTAAQTFQVLGNAYLSSPWAASSTSALSAVTNRLTYDIAEAQSYLSKNNLPLLPTSMSFTSYGDDPTTMTITEVNATTFTYRASSPDYNGHLATTSGTFNAASQMLSYIDGIDLANGMTQKSFYNSTAAIESMVETFSSSGAVVSETVNPAPTLPNQSELITVNSSTINVPDSSTVQVNGNFNTGVLYYNDSVVSIGNQSTFTLNNSNCVIDITGISCVATVMAPGTTVKVGPSSSVTVKGAGAVVKSDAAGSKGSTITAATPNGTLTDDAQGAGLDVDAPGMTLIAPGVTSTEVPGPGGMMQIETFIGDGMTVNGAANTTTNIQGNNGTADTSGAPGAQNQSFNVQGTGESIFGNGASIDFKTANATNAVYGSDTVSLGGGAYGPAMESTLILNPNGMQPFTDMISAVGSYIKEVTTQVANDVAIVAGTQDTIAAAGQVDLETPNAVMTVVGAPEVNLQANNMTLTATGVNIVDYAPGTYSPLTGVTETVYGGKDDLSLGANSYAYLNGSGYTATLAAGDNVNANGSNDSFGGQGLSNINFVQTDATGEVISITGDTAWMYASGNWISASGTSFYFNGAQTVVVTGGSNTFSPIAGSTINLFGTNNTVGGQNGSSVNIDAPGTSNTITASYDTANIFSTSTVVTANLTTFNMASPLTFEAIGNGNLLNGVTTGTVDASGDQDTITGNGIYVNLLAPSVSTTITGLYDSTWLYQSNDSILASSDTFYWIGQQYVTVTGGQNTFDPTTGSTISSYGNGETIGGDTGVTINFGSGINNVINTTGDTVWLYNNGISFTSNYTNVDWGYGQGWSGTSIGSFNVYNLPNTSAAIIATGTNETFNGGDGANITLNAANSTGNVITSGGVTVVIDANNIVVNSNYDTYGWASNIGSTVTRIDGNYNWANVLPDTTVTFTGTGNTVAGSQGGTFYATGAGTGTTVLVAGDTGYIGADRISVAGTYTVFNWLPNLGAVTTGVYGSNNWLNVLTNVTTDLYDSNNTVAGANGAPIQIMTFSVNTAFASTGDRVFTSSNNDGFTANNTTFYQSVADLTSYFSGTGNTLYGQTGNWAVLNPNSSISSGTYYETVATQGTGSYDSVYQNYGNLLIQNAPGTVYETGFANNIDNQTYTSTIVVNGTANLTGVNPTGVWLESPAGQSSSISTDNLYTTMNTLGAGDYSIYASNGLINANSSASVLAQGQNEQVVVYSNLADLTVDGSMAISGVLPSSPIALIAAYGGTTSVSDSNNGASFATYGSNTTFSIQGASSDKLAVGNTGLNYITGDGWQATDPGNNTMVFTGNNVTETNTGSATVYAGDAGGTFTLDNGNGSAISSANNMTIQGSGMNYYQSAGQHTNLDLYNSTAYLASGSLANFTGANFANDKVVMAPNSSLWGTGTTAQLNSLIIEGGTVGDSVRLFNTDTGAYSIETWDPGVNHEFIQNYNPENQLVDTVINLINPNGTPNGSAVIYAPGMYPDNSAHNVSETFPGWNASGPIETLSGSWGPAGQNNRYNVTDVFNRNAPGTPWYMDQFTFDTSKDNYQYNSYFNQNAQEISYSGPINFGYSNIFTPSGVDWSSAADGALVNANDTGKVGGSYSSGTPFEDGVGYLDAYDNLFGPSGGNSSSYSFSPTPTLTWTFTVYGQGYSGGGGDGDSVPNLVSAGSNAELTSDLAGLTTNAAGAITSGSPAQIQLALIEQEVGSGFTETSATVQPAALKAATLTAEMKSASLSLAALTPAAAMAKAAPTIASEATEQAKVASPTAAAIAANAAALKALHVSAVIGSASAPTTTGTTTSPSPSIAGSVKEAAHALTASATVSSDHMASALGSSAGTMRAVIAPSGTSPLSGGSLAEAWKTTAFHFSGASVESNGSGAIRAELLDHGYEGTLPLFVPANSNGLIAGHLQHG